ncbi:hypothetical protein Enr13x_62280 [Stieleria neptunia]|uniref:Uncharacterized protein n=1 Tax=Stieleria neptunia TaxID=2527979 RepID=A0A518HZP5_9BACT|nr:hypothetical protein [Stieleria neptunia]QDV46319.1 hypothetical protein Enr13x_62280 [Stieleria neptunia]
MTVLSRYLGCSTLILALIAGSGMDCNKAWAEDQRQPSSTVAKLQTHRIPDGFPEDVLAQFGSVVPTEKMMYFPERRQLVVYGKPELHLQVMKRIVAVPLQQRAPMVAAAEPRGHVRPLPLPRRPVKIVHLKELDLLLIRFGR